MKGILLPLVALFLSLVILLAGHGVQLTVVPLLATDMGWSLQLISLTGSGYFAGFMLGCLTVPRIVARVGHIRTFAVLTSTATAALLVLPVLPYVPAWIIARVVTGVSIAGLYMVIEGWLNERTTEDNRGAVLSVYTVLTLLAISLGQLSIGLPLEHADLVLIGAMLLTLGAIPVGLTRSDAPRPVTEHGFRLKAVASASSVAVVGALVGGLTTSSYWVLGPIVAETMQLGERQIGFFLAMAILGGALSQLPAGRLSDRIDRRWVMAGLTLLGVLSTVLALLSKGDANLLYPAMFLYGASTFPLYSLCLAHANDNTSLGLFEVGSVILLVHSTGAVFGPPIIAQVLQFSPYGLFMVSGTVLLVFGLWSASRAYFHPSRRQYFEPFTDTPKTSQEVLEVADATHEPDYAEAPTPADP
jgi:MFS family permease